MRGRPSEQAAKRPSGRRWIKGVGTNNNGIDPCHVDAKLAHLNERDLDAIYINVETCNIGINDDDAKLKVYF
jgi:hypothetical protein